MTRWFGTDGIRGRANGELLSPQFVVKLGLALGKSWCEGKESTVVLADDGRRSGEMLRQALSSGMMSAGVNVDYVGISSTPALSYLTRENNVVGGIMISASHNPHYDNGIKVFQPSGKKFTVDQEERIEQLIESERLSSTPDSSIGTETELPVRFEQYLNEFQSLNLEYSDSVVVDCAHGGTSSLAPRILNKKLGNVRCIHNQPDGMNINKQAGSMHPDILSETVRRREASVGFAFDGDGDRLLAVNSRGEIVNGDVLLYMLAKYNYSQNPDSDQGIVITVMSNIGLRKALERDSIPYEVVGVGDRNVYSQLTDNGWKLGGEQSGHIIDRNWLPTGDGLYNLIRVLTILSETETKIDFWQNQVEHYPQVLQNVEVSRKPPLDTLTETSRKISQVEDRLGEQGRVLVRYSGTESVARIMVEGPDRKQLSDYAAGIGECIQRDLGGNGRNRND